MLAVRDNERAAAASGIDVSRVKLGAFALASAIAGVGGGVYAYSVPNMTFTQFAVTHSIFLIAVVYIGGIASIAGGIFAGVVSTGGIVYGLLLNGFENLAQWFMLASGILLVWTVIVHPDGAVVLFSHAAKKFKTSLVGRHGDSASTDAKRSAIAAGDEGPRTRMSAGGPT